MNYRVAWNFRLSLISRIFDFSYLDFRPHSRRKIFADFMIAAWNTTYCNFFVYSIFLTVQPALTIQSGYDSQGNKGPLWEKCAFRWLIFIFRTIAIRAWSLFFVMIVGRRTHAHRQGLWDTRREAKAENKILTRSQTLRSAFELKGKKLIV